MKGQDCAYVKHLLGAAAAAGVDAAAGLIAVHWVEAWQARVGASRAAAWVGAAAGMGAAAAAGVDAAAGLLAVWVVWQPGSVGPL